MGKSVFIKLFICTISIIIISTNFCLPVSHALGKNIFSSELNTEDAIYYGFPIAEEEREKLLAKIKH